MSSLQLNQDLQLLLFPQLYTETIQGCISRNQRRYTYLQGGNHYSWSTDRSNIRGELLAKMLSQHNIVIKNKGDTPTCTSHNGSHQTDIPVCSIKAGGCASGRCLSYQRNWTITLKCFHNRDGKPKTE